MNPSQPLVDSYAAAIKSHMGMASTYYEGVRRIRQSQIDQITAADDECKRYLQQMDGAYDLGSLQTLHAQIISEQVERISSYWTNIGRDLNALHLELSSLMQECGAKLALGLREQLERLQADISQGVAALHLPGHDATAPAGYTDNGQRSSSGAAAKR